MAPTYRTFPGFNRRARKCPTKPGMQDTRNVWGFGFPGDLIGDVNERGEPITGDSIVLLVNAHHEPIPFTLPLRGEGQEWERLIDTADPEAEAIKRKGGEQYEIKGRSMVILRSKPPQPAELPDMK